MSEAQAHNDRIAARLERLAEMDLAAAEHVHAQLMASTEPQTTAELARAYQRASRTLRQTIMLQMKRAREPVEVVRRALAPYAEMTHDLLMGQRLETMQDAVGRVAAAAHPDEPRRQREALDALDVELDDWTRDDEAFMAGRLHDMVVEACELVGLPTELAERWESLPKSTLTFDPATSPPLPTADTG